MKPKKFAGWKTCGADSDNIYYLRGFKEVGAEMVVQEDPTADYTRWTYFWSSEDNDYVHHHSYGSPERAIKEAEKYISKYLTRRIKGISREMSSLKNI